MMCRNAAKSNAQPGVRQKKRSMDRLLKKGAAGRCAANPAEKQICGTSWERRRERPGKTPISGNVVSKRTRQHSADYGQRYPSEKIKIHGVSRGFMRIL